MDLFRVESVRIKTTSEEAFRYISDPKNLPQWTHAFKGVLNGKAIMAGPAGAVEVGLRVKGSASEGTDQAACPRRFLIQAYCVFSVAGATCEAAAAPAGGLVSGSSRNLPMICGTSGELMKL
jgi:hypothetical protein